MFTPASAILRVRSASTPGASSTSTTTTSRSRETVTSCDSASECLAASACLTRMCSSARSAGPTQVAAAMFTPASLIAAATFASAPGVFSTSITKSTAMWASNHEDPSPRSPQRGADGPIGLHQPAVLAVGQQRRGLDGERHTVLDLHRQRRLERLLLEHLPVDGVVDVRGDVEVGAAHRPR